MSITWLAHPLVEPESDEGHGRMFGSMCVVTYRILVALVWDLVIGVHK